MGDQLANALEMLIKSEDMKKVADILEVRNVSKSQVSNVVSTYISYL